MPVSSPITRQTVGKTFIVASSLLGLGALAQFGAITWAFVTRVHPVPGEERTAEQSIPPRLVPRGCAPE
jgi:hypothetical protein